MLARMILGCTCVALFLGCSGGEAGPEKVTLTGKVTYEGEPVADGEISFLPGPGSKGLPTTAAISQGTYKAANQGAIAVGTYRVEIRAYKKKEGPVTDTAGIDRPGAVARDQILPQKYNTLSTLEPLTVAPGKSSQTQDFDLKK
jgi:hypothetical protein